MAFSHLKFIVAKSFQWLFCVIFIIADNFYLRNCCIVNLERNYMKLNQDFYQNCIWNTRRTTWPL